MDRVAAEGKSITELRVRQDLIAFLCTGLRNLRADLVQDILELFLALEQRRQCQRQSVRVDDRQALANEAGAVQLLHTHLPQHGLLIALYAAVEDLEFNLAVGDSGDFLGDLDQGLAPDTAFRCLAGYFEGFLGSADLGAAYKQDTAKERNQAIVRHVTSERVARMISGK